MCYLHLIGINEDFEFSTISVDVNAPESAVIRFHCFVMFVIFVIVRNHLLRMRTTLITLIDDAEVEPVSGCRVRKEAMRMEVCALR